MEFAVGALTNATREIVEAGDPAYTRIRMMTVGKSTAAAPASALAAIAQPWTAVNSTTIGSTNVTFGVFSAACWLTGRDVFNGLNRSTPLGLITSCVSGTPIEEWAPADAIAACPQPAHDPYPSKSTLFNAMVAPLAVGPLALMGTIWWQGEANAAFNQTAYYACQLPAVISSWRSHFGGAAWWGVVQLQAFSHYAAHNDTYDVPWFRDAQAAALALPNVTLATAIDLGDALSPYVNIHIRDKQPAGARLAAGALARVFGLVRDTERCKDLIVETISTK
jgi:sialate O-acetylesterase